MKSNKGANTIAKGSELAFDGKGCMIAPSLLAQDVIDFRHKMAMTQEEFAKAFDIPLSTLRSWEQNRSRPVISEVRLQFFNKLYDEKAQLIESTGSSHEMLMAA